MEQLFKLKQQLNQFLDEHPHLRPFQQELDRQLKAAGSSHNRMAILQQAIRQNLYHLSQALYELSDSIK